MSPATSGVDAAAKIAALGLGSRRWPAGTQAALARAATHDADVRVRIAALGALVRRASPAAAAAAWTRATADPDARARVRAAELAPMVAARSPADVVLAHLVECLADPEPFVAEAAAWALGEVAGAHPHLDRSHAIDALAGAGTDHGDALVREAAVAALGAIGDPAGLPAILAACRDKPAIRRRAVLALAPFEGPQVEAALARATTDRDWQVRQAAEDLTSPG